MPEAPPICRPVSLTVEEAEQVRDLLADAHCWFCGFRAANPNVEIPGAHRLMGAIEGVRDALSRAAGRPTANRDLPF